MLKFKTVRSTFAYLSSNLLNEVGLSLFRYFEVGLRVCDIVVKKFTFAISSPDEFLSIFVTTIAANTHSGILVISSVSLQLSSELCSSFIKTLDAMFRKQHLSEKMRFSCFRIFPGSAIALVSRGGII